MTDEPALSFNEPTSGPASKSAEYRVLARKYRPQTFADMIGQEALVRTLTNAIASGRLAHAFILTGVRGVGKTTTARIIARGLNCIGPEGRGGVTIEPCGICGPCRAIAEGRHVDVLEMDAATHTQVDRMRELLAAVPYRPAESRYKVYIIDEVHMLSTSAFNALLKTLEEPPAHVKFIFATTEIRKVPVTVLSRCQRFDLRRIEPETMLGFLAGIVEHEGVRVAPEALQLITRAAEGSARDALSLLDQAIVHGGGETGLDEVRAMLGLADRGRVLDLFELIMRGEAAAALAELAAQYADGADPLAILRDLAEVTHWVSLVKIAPEAAADPTVSADERRRGMELAAALPMRALARSWQMLLKALEEVATAPNAMMAAEMAVIRLTHVADLPSPEELVRRLQGEAPRPSGPPASSAPAPRTGPEAGASPARPALAQPMRGPQAAILGQTVQAAGSPAPEGLARFARFEDLLGLIREMRDLKLMVEIERHVRLVSYAPGRIEFCPDPEAPAGLAAELARKLQAWTGQRWGISVVGTGGAPTIAEARAAERRDLKAQIANHALVQAVLAAFPGAEIREVRRSGALEPAGQGGYAAPESDEMPEDWQPVDPFGEEI
ncbi:MAG TPA: DNA polymerase III subunit gamma/tau [Paracoccaceae bacterium]|nr:DNA polymerase III subunit gamma/tau [Paracoccaceae bacterium]